MIYSTGILFNQLHDLDSQDEEDDEEDLDYSDDEDNINPLCMSSSFHPSAMGISFALDDGSRDVKVELSYGKYTTIKDLKDGHKHVRVRVPTVENDYRDNLTLQTFFNYSEDDYLELKKPLNKDDRSKLLGAVAEDRKDLENAIYLSHQRFNYGWMRKAYHHTYTMNTKNRLSEEVETGLRLILNVKQDIKSNSRICTLSAVNEQKDNSVNSKMCYFQVSLRVYTTAKQGFLDIRPAIETGSKDMEERSLDLLYRDYGVYSSGHGISTHWDMPTKGGVVKEIQTTTMPKHKVPLVDFNEIPNNENNESIDLSIAGFAYKSPEHCFKNLRSLAEEYSSWIRGLVEEQAELDKHFHETAKMHIDNCRESHNRIIKGIELLEKDTTTFKAFQDSNKAMVMQRKHRDIQNEKRSPKDEYVAPTDYESAGDSWRPFQIAFILMNIESMSSSESKERDIVDLIWFPTGGGKTEAYLGLTAFTVFYRRLTNQEKYGGTTVLMRYTLRLLTSQQFDRACTLICACELLRQQDEESYGKEKITIGLWVGGASSPNTIDDAKKRLDSMRKSSETDNNPFHVLGCPWCGTSMDDKDNMGYKIISRPKRLLIYCPNKQCHFSYNQTTTENIGGLPILVVDEDVYNTPPTLLFGTVDKFAMLPWRKESSSIFALDKENANLSPSLIIQDELHLISGPLGSVVGLYETAIDMLCSAKGVKPKIVASTATIRRAHEQCQALYTRDTNLFPSPGLNASDSFFSRESKKPGGRLYVGVMPSGKTSAKVRPQLMAAIFQAPELIETDSLDLKDTYWTNVIYHNSIKDLGVSRSMIDDTFESHCKRLAEMYPRERRYLSTYKKVQELTGRTKNVPEVLQALEEPHKQEQKKDDSINILLTTIMISVGIDIDRLGIMTIINQPKMTSEYIQASSRVGRRDPGIVFTAYNPVRSRDRSLYEQFQKYHQSLYRYVEPSSVTPFSAGTINRALHGMLITLIRHKMQLHDDELLTQFKPDSTEFTSIVHEILERAGNSTRNPQAVTGVGLEDIKGGINDFINRVNEIIKSGKSIAYSHKREDAKHLMQVPNSKEGGAEFVVYKSMRDTDIECYITIENEYYE